MQEQRLRPDMNAGTSDNTRYLIVSADDFGYFRCVSNGILECHLRGAVTSTAVFGNAPNLDQYTAEVTEATELDMGVHLNLTLGSPLSESLRSKLRRSEGRFPPIFQLIGMLIARKITPEDIEKEWSMQVERCVAQGLRPCFLNSHEHVHMLPGLTTIAGRIADRFQIKHIRVARPDRLQLGRPATFLRDIGLQLLAPWAERKIGSYSEVRFFGTAASGRLSLDYLQDWLPRLVPGSVYELMCHPGYYDPQEIRDHRLLDYHDWEQELAVLTGTEMRELLQAYEIRLIGYRHLADIRRESATGH